MPKCGKKKVEKEVIGYLKMMYLVLDIFGEDVFETCQ
jgi:hypothetical protein